MKPRVLISKCISEDLLSLVRTFNPDNIFIIVDYITEKYCLPKILDILQFYNPKIISIGTTDNNKNLNTLSKVWKVLSNERATRHSLIINLGGGMVTDLGGFAASTFKRGVKFINIPTTLLAMVDASVGGKTGINFNGLKNEIGIFNNSEAVIIDVSFLKTLDFKNVCSGYAEMIKHAIISSEEIWNRLITFDILNQNFNNEFLDILSESIDIKERIIEDDPLEYNVRKALNFGHTIGHSFESYTMIKQPPILHGYAIAFGMICELYLSHTKLNFPITKMRQIISYIKDIYGTFNFDCNDYQTMYDLMKHDKKNSSKTINFTLLEDIGKIKINMTASKEDIFEAFDFIREGL